ncbi:DUF6088 family protein [Sphingomonas sp. Ant H11]|uniref:DUF6088 family protein n=1 Tax=Sphingomonas sp. Ant H11 TaxID=1564113 RepID=UPI0022B0AD2D|nr:DUF6088 family protein [Sphingomonas sp. Ant H11]
MRALRGLPAEGVAETLGSAAGEGFPLQAPSQSLALPVGLGEIENCQKTAYISDRRSAVQRLTEQILAHTEGLPEGAPIAAKSLLHLGNRAAVDQALSRLAERGRLMRAGRGVYLRPVSSRFGVRAPSVEKAVEASRSSAAKPSCRTVPRPLTRSASRHRCRSGRSI